MSDYYHSIKGRDRVDDFFIGAEFGDRTRGREAFQLVILSDRRLK